MNRFAILLFAGILLSVPARVFAFGVDIGPVHLHGTKVKVGSDIELKVVPDKIVRDDDEKDRVRKISAHRKGDPEDRLEIKVVWADLGDESKNLLKKMKPDSVYKMKIEKMDEDWRLVSVRNEDD